MPLWSLQSDDCIRWRLSLFFRHKSKIIINSKPNHELVIKKEFQFLSHRGKIKRRSIEVWPGTGTAWDPSYLKDVFQMKKKREKPETSINTFAEKVPMPSKRYESHCPSRTCTGGYKHKLYRIRGNPNWLNREVWAKKKGGESLCRCAHCGLVWFQESSKRLGLDARPVGYYDDIEHPWEFVSLKHRYTIREQNTSRYWRSVGSKVIRPPKWGGVD